jgi:hypothetical protein
MARCALLGVPLLAACASPRPPGRVAPISVPAVTAPVSDDPVLAEIGLGPEAEAEFHAELRSVEPAEPACAECAQVEQDKCNHKAPNATEIERVALQYEGVRYRYGGRSERGFDCSGFVGRVFAELGYDLPRSAYQQYELGLEVSANELAVGDLLFFHTRPRSKRISHVALYLGNGRFIHAVSGRGRVTFDDLNTEYYAARFVGARRIIAMPPGHYVDAGGAARPGCFFKSQAELVSRFGADAAPCVARAG